MSHDNAWFVQGPQRIFIYGTLFLASLFSSVARPMLGDSFLQAPELWRATNPNFFTLEGVMKFIPLRKHVLTYPFLSAVRNFAIIAWLCQIIGFGGHTPAVIVAITTIFLTGIAQGCIGVSHRWYVPMFTAASLAMANGKRDLSVDAAIAGIWSDYPFAPAEMGVLDTGIARKLVLVAAVSTLFFGGITKLINGGMKWMDGCSLAYYVSNSNNGACKAMKALLQQYPWIAMLLGGGSVIWELASIGTLFVPFIRPYFFASAAAFHFGIWLTMHPNYLPQTLCYLICFNWSSADVVQFVPLTSTITSVTALATIGLILFTAVAVIGVEFFPITGVPMYSYYRDDTFNYDHFCSEEQAQCVALEHANSKYPTPIAWSDKWVKLRLVHKESLMKNSRSVKAEKFVCDFREHLTLPTTVPAASVQPHGHVLPKQYRRILHTIAAIDMATKPTGKLDAISAKSRVYPAEAWLWRMRAVLKQWNITTLPEWAKASGELQLVVTLRDRYVVLGRVPWAVKQTPRATPNGVRPFLCGTSQHTRAQMQYFWSLVK